MNTGPGSPDPAGGARVDHLLAAAAAALAHLDDAPRLAAESLLCQVLGWRRSKLYAHPEHCPSAPQREAYATLVARRVAGEPLAYLLGTQPFCDLTLAVTPAVLIPRADTETLVEAALACALPAGHPVQVLDLGTGSGAVALALARARPAWRLTATDIDPAALAIAQGNAERLGLAARIRFRQADWFEGLPGDPPYDLVVSNPPYIAEGDPHLTDPGLAAEPRHALVAGAEGLDALRRIATDARHRLVPGGWLWLEHGHAQGAVMRDLLRRLGYHDIVTHRDAGARERVTGGRHPPNSRTDDKDST